MRRLFDGSEALLPVGVARFCGLICLTSMPDNFIILYLRGTVLLAGIYVGGAFAGGMVKIMGRIALLMIFRVIESERNCCVFVRVFWSF